MGSDVQLRTGGRAPKVMVEFVWQTLHSLFHENPFVFNELVVFCDNSDRQLSESAHAALSELGLIGSSGQLNELMCEIVRASVEGVGLGLRLVDPTSD